MCEKGLGGVRNLIEVEINSDENCEKVYICQVNMGSISIFRFPYNINLSLFLYILSIIATPSK